MIKQSLATFRKIQRDLGKKLLADHQLVCKVGAYKGSAVIKLQKANWTNDQMNVVPNTSGIFFSVWVDEKFDRSGRISYNIHALKLRELKGYQIRRSTDLAATFRARFGKVKAAWPNARVDYGPLTWMQGWIPATATVKQDVERLLAEFVRMHPIIDEVLDSAEV
ncbi:MAG: hypothetical protein H7Z14_22325 [Anaerolineae bacterium]|nr:hypothetical protein [Phycisphaerae bacterium]